MAVLSVAAVVFEALQTPVVTQLVCGVDSIAPPRGSLPCRLGLVNVAGVAPVRVAAGSLRIFYVDGQVAGPEMLANGTRGAGGDGVWLPGALGGRGSRLVEIAFGPKSNWPSSVNTMDNVDSENAITSENASSGVVETRVMAELRRVDVSLELDMLGGLFQRTLDYTERINI